MLYGWSKSMRCNDRLGQRASTCMTFREYAVSHSSFLSLLHFRQCLSSELHFRQLNVSKNARQLIGSKFVGKYLDMRQRRDSLGASSRFQTYHRLVPQFRQLVMNNLQSAALSISFTHHFKLSDRHLGQVTSWLSSSINSR